MCKLFLFGVLAIIFLTSTPIASYAAMTSTAGSDLIIYRPFPGKGLHKGVPGTAFPGKKRISHCPAHQVCPFL